LQSEYIVDFFNRPEILELLIRLDGAGVPMAYPAWQSPAAAAPVRTTDTRIAGKYFVFTGKLESMKRAEAESLVTRLGGHFQTAVNSMTDFLVTGERVGATKTNAARAKGVIVITEREFTVMAGGS
jgi:DNA ligase (NAD+)